MNAIKPSWKDRLSNERIMVCVYYGPNAKRLIRRGWLFASALQVPLFILTVDPPKDDEYSEEKEQDIMSWKSIAEELGATFLAVESGSRKVAQVIADVAKENKVTQIIMGQSARTRWEEITKGSVINDILREIPFIDLHIVSVKRQLDHLEEEFETGVHAYLEPVDGEYQLRLSRSSDEDLEGLFFKKLHTDFETGLFKTVVDGKKMMVKVTDGTVTELIDVKEAKAKEKH
ncbi:universal stress protein [Paenibacillus senegalensis]|uniref:universal stress protein n=1 Tax=Paenibacillus senegalensis TaxID=1465766 RepID=UPI00028929E2|nr:universal stress protein [Paenibacillus senegalensis]